MSAEDAAPKSIADLGRFGSDLPGRYSTFWDRFIAGFIDGIAMAMIMIPFAIHSGFEFEPYISLAFTFFPFAYTVVLHGLFGKTLGKKIMGLKVIDESETREIGFRQAFLREAVPIAIVALMLIGSRWIPMEEQVDWIDTIWYVLEIGSVLTNEKRRALHDFIAGTVVVKA